MKRKWKKAAACFLAAAMLAGNGNLSMTAGKIPTVEAEEAVSLTLKGDLLVVSGKGRMTETAKSVLGAGNLSKVKKIQVEKGVTALCAQAFTGCENAREVTLPEGLTEIGASAFWKDKSLEKVNVPDSLKTIGNSAFRECTSLKEVVFGKNISTIRDFAFYRCTSLKAVKLPDSVKALGTGAFQECTSLESAELGEGVVSLSLQLFRGCGKLKKVKLGARVEKIGEQSFCLCTSLTEFRIPESVLLVEKDAFWGCKNLNLILPDTMEDQGDGSYQKRGGLKVVGTYAYSEAEKMLNLLNQERVQAGQKPLTMDQELLDGAMLRSAEINVFYSHQRPNGTLFDTVSSRAYKENILVVTASAGTASDALEIWMGSREQKENILNPALDSVGIGCFKQGSITCWVQLFSTEPVQRKGAGEDREAVVDIRAAKDSYRFYLGETKLDLKAGEEKSLQVYLENPGLSQAPAKVSPDTFLWSSSDPSVVKVDEKGRLTPIKGGRAAITAASKYGDAQVVTCQVKVSVKVSGVKVESKTLRLGIGKRYTLKAKVLPESASNQGLVYKSSRPSVVSVDSKGTLRAKKPGTAQISCISKENKKKKAVVKVTVKNYASSLKIKNGKKNLTVGEKLKLEAEVLPLDAVNKQVIWKSSNPKVAKVDKNGVVKALRPGKFRLTCKARYGAGAEKSLTIQVVPRAPKLRAKVSRKTVTLSWKRSPGADQYAVFRAVRPNGSYKRVYYGSDTTLSLSGLKKGKTYYFRIRAGARVGGRLVSGPFGETVEVKIR